MASKLADGSIHDSNARIAGMEEALDLKPYQYQWLLNIFYISYIVFEFQALMWKIVPPNVWAAFVVFGWGISATLQSATRSWATEMVCRFFLGRFDWGYRLPIEIFALILGRAVRGRLWTWHTLPPFLLLPPS